MAKNVGIKSVVSFVFTKCLKELKFEVFGLTKIVSFEKKLIDNSRLIPYYTEKIGLF